METIKVELRANCPYGKIGNIVEVAKDTAKAYGDAMVKSDKKLTDGVDSIVSDIENTKTQADIDAEEKEAQEKADAEKAEADAKAKKDAEEKEAQDAKDIKNKETKEVKKQETK